MKSFREQAAYYRARALRMADNGEAGIVDPAYAKAQVACDLAWSRYYVERSKGKKTNAPHITVEDRMALEEARQVDADQSMKDYLDMSLDDELE